MKQPWLEDENEIYLEMDRLIRERILLVCGRRGAKDLIRLAVKGVVKGKEGDIVVLFHPHDQICSSSTCTFYYRPEGEQLRCFDTIRVRKVDRFLGVKMPTRICKVYHRNYERVRGVRDSSLSFTLPKKRRVFKGRVDNISLGGCRIMGKIPSRLKKGDVVNNLGLILFTKRDAGKEWRLHIPQATVAWPKVAGSRKEAVGVSFSLSGYPQQVLTEYIDLRLIENAI